MQLRSILLVSLALASACDSTTTSTTSAPTKAASALPQASLAAALPVPAANPLGVPLTFDASTSKIGFTGHKITGQHSGSFGAFSGRLTRGDEPAKSSVVVVIDMASLTADPPKLAEHLKSAEFFDVAQFAKATFTSTSVTPGEGGKVSVTGNLELHGVTKSLTFPATLSTTPEKTTLTAAFRFDRKAFGITYPGKADDLIADDVDLTLDIVATARGPVPGLDKVVCVAAPCP